MLVNKVQRKLPVYGAANDIPSDRRHSFSNRSGTGQMKVSIMACWMTIWGWVHPDLWTVATQFCRPCWCSLSLLANIGISQPNASGESESSLYQNSKTKRENWEREYWRYKVTEVRTVRNEVSEHWFLLTYVSSLLPGSFLLWLSWRCRGAGNRPRGKSRQSHKLLHLAASPVTGLAATEPQTALFKGNNWPRS